MSYRIFAGVTPAGSGPQRPEFESAPTNLVLEVSSMVMPEDPTEIELLRILDDNVEPGESLQRAFDRKEHALVTFVASLGRNERVAVMERITAGAAHDAVVQRMTRFTSERRNRILTAIARSDRRSR